MLLSDRDRDPETPRPWDRRSTETTKAYAAFLALGARRSVREAARQHHVKTTSAGDIKGVEDTTVRTWITWSAKHKWVSRVAWPATNGSLAPRTSRSSPRSGRCCLKTWGECDE